MVVVFFFSLLIRIIRKNEIILPHTHTIRRNQTVDHHQTITTTVVVVLSLIIIILILFLLLASPPNVFLSLPFCLPFFRSFNRFPFAMATQLPLTFVSMWNFFCISFDFKFNCAFSLPSLRRCAIHFIDFWYQFPGSAICIWFFVNFIRINLILIHNLISPAVASLSRLRITSILLPTNRSAPSGFVLANSWIQFISCPWYVFRYHSDSALHVFVCVYVKWKRTHILFSNGMSLQVWLTPIFFLFSVTLSENHFCLRSFHRFRFSFGRLSPQTISSHAFRCLMLFSSWLLVYSVFTFGFCFSVYELSLFLLVFRLIPCSYYGFDRLSCSNNYLSRDSFSCLLLLSLLLTCWIFLWVCSSNCNPLRVPWLFMLGFKLPFCGLWISITSTLRISLLLLLDRRRLPFFPSNYFADNGGFELSLHLFTCHTCVRTGHFVISFRPPHQSSSNPFPLLYLCLLCILWSFTFGFHSPLWRGILLPLLPHRLPVFHRWSLFFSSSSFLGKDSLR